MEEKNSVITHFAKTLRQRRHELAITQEQLAEKAALNWSYIGELERGERNPAITTAIALARALNISFEDLVEGKKEADAISKNSEFISFFDFLFKAIILASSITNEAVRVSVVPQLTLLGLYYLAARQSKDFKGLSKKMRVSHESIEEILASITDKKLAYRISSSVYQMNLLLQD